MVVGGDLESSDVGSVGECEVKELLCERPFLRLPVGGVDVVTALTNPEAREALAAHGCGQCLPCRKLRASVWSHRIMLEARSHVSSLFVTLTYNAENVPNGGTLLARDLTLFMKRLRFNLNGRKIRYFNVGEYGSDSQRPHYHCVLFGMDLADEPIIAKSWDKGFIQVSELTEGRSSYMCKYVVKDLGKKSDKLNGREPEFMRCSKMDGGLGKKAVVELAQDLQKNPWSSEIQDVTAFRYGRQKRTLGRYLTTILEEHFPKAKQTRLLNYDKATREQILKHIDKGALYRDSILEENQPRREQLKARHKFFSKRGQI